MDAQKQADLTGEPVIAIIKGNLIVMYPQEIGGG